MNYYVWFCSGQYDPWLLSEFSTEQEVVTFLNTHAGNHEFIFKVVRGSEVAFKAVTTATAYIRDMQAK